MKTREIPLSGGRYALVDERDYERLASFVWYFSAGYARRKEGRRWIYMHREVVDAPDGRCVDHANGDGLDNRRANLRPCTAQENLRNARKREGATSRFKGVSLHRKSGKWMAHITIDGKARHLGLFADEADAARAYDDAARRFFGPFKRLNFA